MSTCSRICPANADDPTGFPDFVFWLAESAVVAEPRRHPATDLHVLRLEATRSPTARHHFSRRRAAARPCPPGVRRSRRSAVARRAGRGFGRSRRRGFRRCGRAPERPHPCRRRLPDRRVANVQRALSRPAIRVRPGPGARPQPLHVLRLDARQRAVRRIARNLGPGHARRRAADPRGQADRRHSARAARMKIRTTAWKPTCASTKRRRPST